jgi:ubiquinone/menaquinone biosynthesis C-methylase UbiE
MSTSSSDTPEEKVRFVADTESSETMTWLLNFDKIINHAMGGTLPERPDLSGIKDILDLACGPGGWILEMAREHPEIQLTGVDISRSMIQFAKAQVISRGYDNVSFSVADIKQPLPFEANSFDLVNERTLFGVMAPHEWPALLAECKRVLRPGGIVRLTELELPITTSPALNKIWRISAQAFYNTRRTFSVDGEHIGITPMLRPLLHQAGFQNVQYRGYVLDISAGTPKSEGYLRNFIYVCQLIKPFLIKGTGITEQEYDRLYQQMQAEMQAENFCGLWMYVTVWGEKA